MNSTVNCFDNGIYHSRRELEAFHGQRLGNLRRRLGANTRSRRVPGRRTLGRIRAAISLESQPRIFRSQNVSVIVVVVDIYRLLNVRDRVLGGFGDPPRGGSGNGNGGVFGVLRSVLGMAVEEMLDAELARLGMVVCER